MGESVVDSSNIEDKNQIAETASSNAALEVSVSFGRFENDSLSWERFSTFSPNKYLEEVERCATPGSVAEKRAYFEAHYRKIAARKAELMEQEKQMENDNSRSSRDLNSGDLTTGNTFGTNFHYDTSNSQDSAEATERETNSVSEVSSNLIDEANEDSSITIECQSSAIGVKEELGNRLDFPKFARSEEVDMVREEEETEITHTIESKDAKGLPQNLDYEAGNVTETKDEYVKSDRPKASRKIGAANKEKDTPGVKKKPVSPIAKTPQLSTPRASKPAPAKAQLVSTPRVSKSVQTKTPQFSTPRVSKLAPNKTPQFSTPRVSKPAPTPSMMTASRSSVKKENGTSVPSKKKPSAVEGKRVTPKSLHMSLSIDPATPPAHSDPASLSTTRKSLIMERMGDKDIVKRAFKTFQNNFNQLRSYSEERSSVSEQASTRGTDLKDSGTMTIRKENGGSIRVGSTEKRSAKAAPSSFGLKSNEGMQKHKEISKKLQEKSNTRPTERTQVQPKSKEQKEAEIKKLTRSLDLKAGPTSGLYRGKKISTGPSH